MPSKRCTTCEDRPRWPAHRISCPECGGEKLVFSSNLDPMPKDEYDERMAWVRFRSGEGPPDFTQAQRDEFEADWTRAEEIAQVSELQGYPLTVADLIDGYPRREAA